MKWERNARLVAPMAAQETIEDRNDRNSRNNRCSSARDSEELEFVSADGADEEETLAVALT